MNRVRLALLASLILVGAFIVSFMFYIPHVARLVEENERRPEDASKTIPFNKFRDIDLHAGLNKVVTWYTGLDRPIVSGTWFRGSDDLPYFNYTLCIHVRNEGKRWRVDNVTIVVETNKRVIYNVTTIITEEYYKQIPMNIRYDDFDLFFLHVYCQENVPEKIGDAEGITPPWWLNKSPPFDLPPWIDPENIKLYITPRYEGIEGLVKQITLNATGWEGIVEWVDESIEYVDEAPSSDCWQLGHETMERGMGDDEDISILLCSLLRADGWSEDEAYVVWWIEEDMSRSCCVLKVPNENIWMMLRPEKAGIAVEEFNGYNSLMDAILGDVDEAKVFNDVFFESYTSLK